MLVAKKQLSTEKHSYSFSTATTAAHTAAHGAQTIFVDIPLSSIQPHALNRPLRHETIQNYCTTGWGRTLDTIKPAAHPIKAVFNATKTAVAYEEIRRTHDDTDREYWERIGARWVNVSTWSGLLKVYKEFRAENPTTNIILPPWIIVDAFAGQHRVEVLRQVLDKAGLSGELSLAVWRGSVIADGNVY